MSVRSRIASTAGVLALAAAGVAWAVVPATAQTGNAMPVHVFAPYVDAGLNNTTLTQVADTAGTKYFTLAFVDGAGCQWSLPNESGWQNQIAALRAQGGGVSLSFGGYTSDTEGTDLGSNCGSPGAAAAQIESAISALDVQRIDYDIESSALDNAGDVSNTVQALAQVRSWAAAVGRPLSISVTLPAATSGLTSAGLGVLTTGLADGFTPDIVNIMAMDYGSWGTEMGSAAEQALDGTAGQVASAFGLSTGAAYGRLGVTPMIGQNDSPGETFTLGDAATVESYAASKGLAELSLWSEGRDNGSCPGTTSASSTCSGLSQNTGDFTAAFQPFTRTTAAGHITGYAGLCVDDRSGSTADFTPIQGWTCNGTNAQQWSVGSGSTLQALGKCMDIAGGATNDGAVIDLYDCNGTGAQVWVPQPDGALLNPQSGKCLDDTNWATTPGTQLQIWDCSDHANQVWTLS